jgi:hypothetical protein
VKGGVWSWEQFERVEEVPEEFPGNLLQPEGVQEWIFEPGMVSNMFDCHKISTDAFHTSSTTLSICSQG